MDINRFLIFGIDTNKSQYACCSFDNIEQANNAVKSYTSLGVTPKVMDLYKAIRGISNVRPHSLRGTNKTSQTPNPVGPKNPTTARLSRWLVVERHPDMTYDYSNVSTKDAAVSIANSLATQGYMCVVIDVLLNVVTNQIVPTSIKGKTVNNEVSIILNPSSEPEVLNYILLGTSHDSKTDTNGILYGQYATLDTAILEGLYQTSKGFGCLVYDKTNDEVHMVTAVI